MSLNQAQLEQHCEYIIKSPRIKNKIVVLCEGKINLDYDQSLSPQSYKRMEEMPDANFYKACIPQTWRNQKILTPQFFNCGNCANVIDSYFQLLEIHQENPDNSYLSPNKLVAIIDLDIQQQTIYYDYPFANKEAIFNHLYEKGKVKTANLDQHHIFVTGLIHKEAYFIVPELQDFFDNYIYSLVFNNSTLKLDDIYLNMSNDLINDPDIKDNLITVKQRINNCQSLDITDLNTIQNSWQINFNNVTNDEQKKELIMALLMIKKVKEYWHQISQDNSNNLQINEMQFREQMSLEIAKKFYAKQEYNEDNHIRAFFERLAQLV
jgi:hypothetical protein